MRARSRAALPAVVVVALVAATGCGADPAPQTPAPPTPATTTPVGTATSAIDVLFLTMMVAHTEQTLEIVRLGRDRVADPQVRTLIAAIDVTETDELATMRGWLREAGPSAMAAADRHDHSRHSDAVAGLTRLRAAPPGEVDAVLLDVLGAHQRTAAGLARAQVRAGTSERIRELARRIERSRTAEVELMATFPTAPSR